MDVLGTKRYRCLLISLSHLFLIQLYPEDLIVSCVNLVRNQLTGVIYRVLEMSTNTDELSSMLNLGLDSLLV